MGFSQRVSDRVPPSPNLPKPEAPVLGLGLRVWGSEFRVWGLGMRFRVWGSGFRVWGLRDGVQVWGMGFRARYMFSG